MGGGTSILNQAVNPGTVLEGSNNVSLSSPDKVTFLVSTVKDDNFKLELPDQIYLKIAKESIDFLDKDSNNSIINFPYQSILCWGSSPVIFQFTVDEQLFDSKGDLRTSARKIIVRTNEGRDIETIIMKTVRYIYIYIYIYNSILTKFD